MSDSSSIQIRGKRRSFTMVYDDLLPPNAALSARGWGLYCYLTGRPEGWETRVSHLRTVFREGRDAIYTALGELVEVGLMSREAVIEAGLRRTRYVLELDPSVSSRVLPDPDSQGPGNPDPEKPGQVSKEVNKTEEETLLAADAATQPKETKTRKRHRLPDDFIPNDTNRRLARENSIDLHVEGPQFLDYHRSRGNTMVDWNLALNTWIREAAKRAARRGGPAPVAALPDGQLPPPERGVLDNRAAR